MAAMNMFSRTTRALDLLDIGYTLHSLRHGGATFEWLERNSFDDIMLKGRWRSKASCRHYLNAGKVLLISTQFSASALELIRTHAAWWRHASKKGVLEQSTTSSKRSNSGRTPARRRSPASAPTP